MADTNAQMEELARILEQVNYDMAQFGKLQKQTADDKYDAEVKAKYGINNATKGLASLGEGLTAVAGAGMAAGKAMYEGKKGAAAFNDSIDGLTKAAQAAGIALTLMIPGGPLLKLFIAGLTAAVTATAEYVKAANDMADKLYKGYSGLAKSGAAASDGMTGVYNGAKKLGLSMNELDGYIDLIGQNSKDLALLSGSVYAGRKQFEDMGEAMEPYRKGLIAAGISQEMINEGSMGYLKLQTRIGAAQRMTTDQLAEGAKRYLIEQDALTKLTGTSRKEIEDQMEAARSEQRFRAKLEEVRATQGEAAAKRLENANIIISSQSKEMGQAFRDTTTGFLGTEAAMKGNMTTQGELMRSTQQLISGQKDEFQAVTDIGKVAKQFGKDMNVSAQLGVLNDFAIDYAQTVQFGIFAEQDKSEMMKKITAEQKKQGIEGGAAADKITDQYAKNIKQQQELNKRLEDAVFKGIDNALSLTNKLGNVTSSLTTAFETLTTGVNKLLNILGLGTKEDKSAVKQQEIGTAESKYKEAQAAQKSAKTPEEKAAADREAKFYQEKVDLLKQEKAVIIKQETNAKLDAEVLKRADDEIKLKEAAYDKAFATATITQKMGIGMDADQTKARGDYLAAQQKERDLRSNKGGMRDAAKADLAKQQASAPSATAPKSSAPPTTGRPTKTGEGDLAGLTIKEGDVHAEGSKVSPKIIDIAKQVQASLPNFAYFSGFNDKFHQEKSPSSSHTSGKAMDFALSQPPSIEEGQEISKYLKSMGASVVIDEYNFPSSKATAGHIHAQIPGYADGGVASTPQIAMVAEKGPEAMIPLDNGAIPIKIKLSDALSTPTFAGINEYAGYNQGPMSTDLSAVKSIAEAVGAFDKVSQTITDPKMWKDILSSGLATNYQLGAATLGTQGIPGLGNDIAERLKEIKEQTNTDSESALKLVADEFKSAMTSMSQQLAQMVGNQNEGGMSGLASLMQELVTATKNGVDVQEKILRVQQ